MAAPARIMNSTEEVKKATRLAQQYNLHLYKYLIHGLYMNSSRKTSQFRFEQEEYRRSTMKFYDRLYQIRDSMLPPDIVREQQINVFREQVKRNDYLRQEVFNVQRSLWNLTMRGQKIPMADKHLILQGFPELYVSNSPDKVPLNIFCEQITHKYNIKNERFITDMLRWADEQSQARKMARQAAEESQARKMVRRADQQSRARQRPSTPDFPHINTILAALEKAYSTSEQDKPDHQTPEPTTTGHVEDQPTPSNDGMNEVTPVPSWCDFDEAVKQVPPKQEDDMDIEDSTKEEKNDVILDKEISPETPTALSKSAQLASFTESIEEIRAKIYFQMKSADSNMSASTQAQQLLDGMKKCNKPAPVVLGEKSPVCNTPNQATNVLPIPEVSTPTVEIKYLKPEKTRVPTTETTIVPTAVPIIVPTKVPTVPTAVPTVPRRTPVDSHKEPAPQIKTSSQQNQSKVSVSWQGPKDVQKVLVGSDRPHVFENKIKRRQHGASSVTASMTPGELMEFEKKRDEVLQAMEIKKQRTKMLLNKQYEKSSQQKTSSIHYYQVQNTPKVKSSNTPAAVPTKPDQSCKPRSDTLATAPNSSSLNSRKRPATSVNTGSTAPKRARSSRPRIILKIFRDEEIDDWNVEQVIDRY